MAEFDEEELKALLSSEITSAVSYDSSELSEKKSRALEYYRGVMADTPAMEGRSQIVSRDVADTIGWMLPGIIRVFTASDRMAVYEAEKPGDEAFAQQATDYVNFVFMRDNQGYRTLWDATHDSLLLANGIVKHWWDKKEECEYTEHSGLTEEQIAVLESDQNVEVIAKKDGEPQVMLAPAPTGQLMEVPIQTFDVKVKRVLRNGRLKVKCIKKLLLNREATCIEDARFLSHPEDVTRSDLIEMGFDRELVENLPIDRFSTTRQEDISRNDNAVLANMVGHESMMLVELHECYVKMDVDGDGIAETVRAFYAGGPGTGELLDWEIWEDDVPFSDIPCEPVPHQWEARSVFDDTEDLQRVKTVLTRQFLDNTYWNNNPMTAAEEGSVVNAETLRSPRFGATVYYKKGSAPPTPLPVPYIGEKALLALQHFDNVREMRTGVSRSTMALDPEALQNQTATANQNQKDSAYSQIELIARNQAELGWRRVFRQILKLIVKHQDRPRTIRLRDTWVEMDPRSWNANMDVTINIGLGTGSRDRDMAMLNQILNVQMAMTDRLAQGGFAQQALDMIPKINLTATKLAESAGIKNPDQFYLDIKQDTLEQMKQQASQPKPDPAMAKVQADTQIKQAELQQRDKEMVVNAQIAQQADERKAQIEAVQAEADMATEREKLQGQFALEQQKFEFEKELKLLEMAMKREQHDQQMAQRAEQHRQQMESGVFKAVQGQQAHEQKMEAAKSAGDN
ncbi:MAG TPA: hypothetical protein PLR85_14370 [Nitrospira sp.]|nr:hypothetical protein [Nitrospira sp.]HNI19887.1 hypothetical protein [Nitrospira sp.]